MTKYKIKTTKDCSKIPFIPHFCSILTRATARAQTNHLETFYMFGKMIRLSESQRRGFKFEGLIPLCFHLQMSDDVILKSND